MQYTAAEEAKANPRRLSDMTIKNLLTATITAAAIVTGTIASQAMPLAMAR